MATIKDIARAAGVSNTTVSNVVHGKGSHVSPETVARIHKIIQELGYVPNMSARALVSNRSKVVAIINHIVPKQSDGVLADPFHSAFISAIEERLRNSGYYLMLRTVEDARALRVFLDNWNLDGLFLTGVFEDEFCETLTRLDKPTVLIDSYLHNYHHMYNVGLEDFQGGYIATQYLLANGHRRIAFACPPLREGGVVWERLRGYRKALEEAGVTPDPALIFQKEFTTHGTMALGAELAKRRDFTAIFATADIMAAGIMSGLQQAGCRVPEDISIVGFDDINWCRMTKPMLTTVHQDATLKGETAADFMIRLLQGDPPRMRSAILPVGLTVRDSVRLLRDTEKTVQE